jgi:hypothetical protein
MAAVQHRGFRNIVGFPPGGVAWVIGIGLAFLVLTFPTLFHLLADINDPHWIAPVFDRSREWSDSWSVKVHEPAVDPYNEFVVKAILLGIPVLWAAALIRSLRAESHRPLVATVLASLSGILFLPAIGWFVAVATFLLWLAATVYAVVAAVARAITTFLVWISPVLAVLALLAAAVALWFLIAYIHRRGLWARAVLIACAVVGATAVLTLGLLDEFFGWIAHLYGLLTDWLAHYVAPVIGWIVQGIGLVLVVGLAAFVLGLALCVVGRSVVLPLASASRSGSDQAKCVDLAAGAGITISVLLCAAATDPVFSQWLTALWAETPLIGSLPAPMDLYSLLLPDTTQHFLAESFTNYSPTVSGTLSLMIIALGGWSLLFSPAPWAHAPHLPSQILRSLGITLLTFIPLLLLKAWLMSMDDS